MFCFQCQETAKNRGCTLKGVCGKTEEVAGLQDILLFISKGTAFLGMKAEEAGINDEEAGDFIIEALFTSVTNVNFDPDRLYSMIKRGLKVRDSLKEKILAANPTVLSGTILHESVNWNSAGSIKDCIENGVKTGILSTENEDIRSLRELLVYGLKGIAAYYDHASLLGYKDKSIISFVKKALVSTIDNDAGMDRLVELVIEAGKNAVNTMSLLDNANTGSYGVPEITEVYTGTIKGPAILVSGHDLKDFEEILVQTENTGVNVYTHGEMLPACAYPAFKRYKHLVGNYGTSWYNQQKEFDAFNGAIIMTTNCIQKPKDSYNDRIFTTGIAAYEGTGHIADRHPGKQKDFSAAVKKAKDLGGLNEIPGKKITIGFNHRTILSVADKIIDAVKTGTIKRFVVMGGCDGRQKGREYFTEIAQNLPEDAVILTAGCAKFRYNMLDLGDIGGIPRIIDAGQCNDSYSLAIAALKLVEIFGTKGINDLPISFDIAWYEQKAVAVLLALLYLGVKGIRLGPTLPAFLSPNVVNFLVEKFDLKMISNVKDDIKAMMDGR